MPTSSQSQILSVVDHQILQQQQASGQDGITKPSIRISLNQTPVNESRRYQHTKDRYSSTGNRYDDDDDNQSPPPHNATARRRSSGKINDGKIKKSFKTLREIFNASFYLLNFSYCLVCE
jgi:hypothetical protein